MSPAPYLVTVDRAEPSAGELPISVVIAEDHPLMLRSLRRLLEEAGGIEVVGEAADLGLARRQVAKRRPDVLVLDLRMGETSSIEEIGRLQEATPATHVVAVSIDDTPGLAQQALATGATCFVLKDHAEADLPAAVRCASRGEEYVSERVATRLRAARQALTDGRLSARETEVLRLIALGYTTIEIAHQLRLSPRTIETHRAHIYRKLELRTRAELVRYALRSGLLTT
jgi:DNA-binding NarL/FixJ family response regulator